MLPSTVYCILVQQRLGFLSCCACFSSEISSLFVIAAVRPKHAISSFSSIFRVARSICATTRVFSMMSKREFWHPQIIEQIMLLSRVASHELSTASAPLVGCLHFFGGGCSLMSIIRRSLLVWESRIGALVLSAWTPSSFFPSIPLPLDRGRCWTPYPYQGGGSDCGLHCVSSPPDWGDDSSHIISHQGTKDNGHYTAMTSREDKWTLYNDAITTQTTTKHIRQTQAYILMYRKTEQSTGTGKSAPIDSPKKNGKPIKGKSESQP